MRVLIARLFTTMANLLGPGGMGTVIADTVLMKQQLLVINRARQRAPNRSALERFLLGSWSLFLSPHRIQQAAVLIRPSTLLKFHNLLKQRKYRRLYSSGIKRKPGRKGPSQELIQAIVQLKQHNPRFGCPRIAQQINRAFGTTIDKDVVRRILAAHYRPGSGDGGPSWLTFIEHAKDSLWSVDLFRCESILLKSHWVLLVMDQFTRRIIGFDAHADDLDAVALCRMFNTAISAMGTPQYLSSDRDPLFTCHRWTANLSIIDVHEIKTIPYAPRSHPFIERLTGTIRREFLDHTLFWNTVNLERELETFKAYYNRSRTHASRVAARPLKSVETVLRNRPSCKVTRGSGICGGLFQLPVAA